jgi:hypothetical protein
MTMDELKDHDFIKGEVMSQEEVLEIMKNFKLSQIEKM